MLLKPILCCNLRARLGEYALAYAQSKIPAGCSGRERLEELRGVFSRVVLLTEVRLGELESRLRRFLKSGICLFDPPGYSLPSNGPEDDSIFEGSQAQQPQGVV